MRHEYTAMCFLCVSHRLGDAIFPAMDAAEEIKAWRKSLGWTQERGAEALGVPVQTIRAWEIGRYLPRHRRVLTLALAQITTEQQKHPKRRSGAHD
jgi:DNA-binding transcriptional regulator YiaG